VPEDYVFEEAGPGGAPVPVRLSELFEPGRDTLILRRVPAALGRDPRQPADRGLRGDR
jgi:hypothetical protein